MNPLPPVVLSPAVKGRFRWLGSRTVQFEPEHRFPQATAFTVTVPRGTAALDPSITPLSKALLGPLSSNKYLPQALEHRHAWVLLETADFVSQFQTARPSIAVSHILSSFQPIQAGPWPNFVFFIE